LTDGITIVRGPTPPVAIVPVTPGKIALPATIIWRAVLLLMLLAAAGLGWSTSLMKVSSWNRAALAPAFGIATLVLGGVLGSSFGGPLDSWPTRTTTLALAGVGWVPVGYHRFKERRNISASQRPG